MLNVEPILLISMLLFNTAGQLFHKVLPMDVPYLHKDDVTEILMIKFLGHIINIDLNSWFTDLQKTLFHVFVVCYHVPILSSSLN